MSRLLVATGALVEFFDPRTPRVLLSQRTPDRDFPWHWECPGGKVEDGESEREALAREFIEEVGLHVRVAAEPFYRGRYDVRDGCNRACEVLIYRVTMGAPGMRPTLGDLAGLGWFALPLHGALPVVPSVRDGLAYLWRARHG